MSITQIKKIDGIEKVPEDCIFEILSFMDYKEVENFFLVSKGWVKIIQRGLNLQKYRHVVNSTFSYAVTQMTSVISFESISTIIRRRFHFNKEHQVKDLFSCVTHLSFQYKYMTEKEDSFFKSCHGLFRELKRLNISESLVELNFLENIYGIKCLKRLDAARIRIVDIDDDTLCPNVIESISKITNLEFLNISYNNWFGEIDALQSLKNLKVLNCANTRLEKLPNLTCLEQLYVERTRIKGLNIANESKLVYLNAEGSVDFEWQKLILLEHIEEAILYGCVKISDISFVQGWNKIKKLDLSKCPIIDIELLRGKQTLEILKLRDCKKIKSFEPITKLGSLRQLDISECDMNSFQKQVRCLPMLEKLVCNNIVVSQNFLPSVVKFKNLKNLKLENSDFSQLDGIEMIQNNSLRNLNINNSQICNETLFALLSSMRIIEVLHMEDLKCLSEETDFSKFPELIPLRHLNISKNKINIKHLETILEKTPNIIELNIIKSSITTSDAAELIKIEMPKSLRVIHIFAPWSKQQGKHIKLLKENFGGKNIDVKIKLDEVQCDSTTSSNISSDQSNSGEEEEIEQL